MKRILGYVLTLVLLVAIPMAYATVVKDSMEFKGSTTISGTTTLSGVTSISGAITQTGTISLGADMTVLDAADINIGTNSDFIIDSDTAETLDITPGVDTDDDSVLNLGANTNGMDLKIFGATTGEYWLFDASADSVLPNLGNYLFTATDAEADQFKVDATGAVAGNAINFETTDGGILLNADGAANGDIGIDAADDLTLTAAGDMTLAVTGTVSAGNSQITNVRTAYEDVTAANVLTSAECGKMMTLNSATEFQTTLPAISGTAGCVFEFYVAAAPASASYTIITGNSTEDVMIGGFVEREVDTGDDGPYDASADTITFVDGVSVVGDYVRVHSSGSSWFVTGVANADGGLTITDSD